MTGGRWLDGEPGEASRYPDWRRGLRHGCTILAITAVSEGGIVIFGMWLLRPKLTAVAIAALIALPLLLFAFGVVAGACRAGR